jgi:hypothetical protein
MPEKGPRDEISKSRSSKSLRVLTILALLYMANERQINSDT